MDQGNYQQLIEIFGNMNEITATTELDIIKLLFKKIMFGDREIPAIQELWFEKEEIKADIEYYQLIISLISAFISHCSDKKSQNEELLAKEIFSLFQNTKYFCLYNNLIELSKLFGLGEKYFIEISCGLYILGSKKGTPANAYLIETLKDFTKEKIIKDSRFYNQIISINYETINEYFMKNLLLLYNLIISKGDKEKIKCQIKMLGNFEEYKSQRLSSVSNNFENIDNEDRKLNAKKKNSEIASPIKAEENPDQENEKKNKGDKKDDDKNDSPKLIKTEFFDLSNNNTEEIDPNCSLDELLDFIKKKSEKFKEDENDKDKNTIINIVMPIFQRHNRYYSILQQLSISKSTIKEIENFQIAQKKIDEIEKCLIEINMMKSFIESLKIPSIIIAKRKIIDLIIFSLIKLNKDKFNLDKNYFPNISFLKKVMTKIDNYSKNIKRKDENEKVEEHKKFIDELIKKKITIIEFPFSCLDKNLDLIMRYLGFCKGKYNKIVNISEETLKYYLYLPFNDRVDSKSNEMLNLFIIYGKNKDNLDKNNTDLKSENKIEEKKENGNDENETNSIYEKPLKLNFDIALDFLLKDNFGIHNVTSSLEKKLEEIESKKNLFVEKYNDYVREGWRQLFIIYEKFDNMEKKNNMNIFYPSEKKLINDITKDFEDTLKVLETNLLELKEVKDGDKMKEMIEHFFSKFSEITQKELKFDSDYYLNLCETIEGRYLLIFFQIQLIKYQLLDLYSKKFEKILNDYYEINKNNIMAEINELKYQSREMLEEMKKINTVKSPEKMFIEWKFSRYIITDGDFKSFIDGIKNYINSIELKLNDDLISDPATSLWLIKNDLDQYVD